MNCKWQLKIHIFFLFKFQVPPWRWRQYVSLKRLHLRTNLHATKSKNVIAILAAVKTSSFTSFPAATSNFTSVFPAGQCQGHQGNTGLWCRYRVDALGPASSASFETSSSTCYFIIRPCLVPPVDAAQTVNQPTVWVLCSEFWLWGRGVVGRIVTEDCL
jgi:hypothetical protein